MVWRLPVRSAAGAAACCWAPLPRCEHVVLVARISVQWPFRRLEYQTCKRRRRPSGGGGSGGPLVADVPDALLKRNSCPLEQEAVAARRFAGPWTAFHPR